MSERISSVHLIMSQHSRIESCCSFGLGLLVRTLPVDYGVLLFLDAGTRGLVAAIVLNKTPPPQTSKMDDDYRNDAHYGK